MKKRVSQIVCSLALTAILAGCASSQHGGGLSLQLGGPAKKIKDKRFEAAHLLNRSPRLLIATPKKRRSESGGGGSSVSLVGGLQENKGDDYETNKSLAPGTESDVGATIGGALGAVSSLFKSKRKKDDGRYDNVAEEEIILPVVSTVYGGGTTVLKAVNGGFGMLLLREGQPKNILACHALFMKMGESTDSEIESSVERGGEGLRRPTYWLDKRTAPARTYVRKKRKKKKLLHLSNSGSKTDPAHHQKKDDTENAIQCWDRVQNYNFAISHALIKRLGLFDRAGPFLAAWRADGRRAMVLDMSNLVGKRDFDLAMGSWINTIIKRPDVWEMGVIESDIFRKKVRHLINKTGGSSMMLKTPSNETAAKMN